MPSMARPALPYMYYQRRVGKRHAVSRWVSADVPFALLYLLNGERGHARLAGAMGVRGNLPADLPEVDLAGQGRRGTQTLAEVGRSGRARVLDDASALLGPGPGIKETARPALVLPVGRDRTTGRPTWWPWCAASWPSRRACNQGASG